MYVTQLPVLLYILSGPIYEQNHAAISKPGSTFNVDIRNYWTSHTRMMRTLGNNYNVKTVVVTYETDSYVLNWTRRHVNDVLLTNKKHSTQVTTRIYGLTYFNNLYNASYYFMTRVDIVYLPRTIHAISQRTIGDNVLALHTFLGDYVNDVFFAFKQEHIARFIFCASQTRKYSKFAGIPPIDSHELHMCMRVDTLLGKEKITVRTPNDMYKLSGFIRKPLFIYYIGDMFTSLFNWNI